MFYIIFLVFFFLPGFFVLLIIHEANISAHRVQRVNEHFQGLCLIVVGITLATFYPIYTVIFL